MTATATADRTATVTFDDYGPFPQQPDTVWVAGTRSIGRGMEQRLADRLEGHLLDLEPSRIIHGAADGPDTGAAIVADRHDIPQWQFPVRSQDWDSIGAKAGPLRNARLATIATHAVMVWDGRSSGTSDSIERALEDVGVDNTIVLAAPTAGEDVQQALERLESRTGYEATACYAGTL